jgi:hypothetical protein
MGRRDTNADALRRGPPWLSLVMQRKVTVVSQLLDGTILAPQPTLASWAYRGTMKPSGFLPCDMIFWSVWLWVESICLCCGPPQTRQAGLG